MPGTKICVVGAGSTYTPELVEGLITNADTLDISELWLMDIDPYRLHIVGGLTQRMVGAAGGPFDVAITADRKAALADADFVITQIRVGGMKARILDERIPVEFDVIGQETTGPGGFAKALRTVPKMLDIAAEMLEVAPEAWLINFTNPAGLITEAVHTYRTHRVIGLCNSPIGLQRDLAEAFEALPDEVELDYVGLNHLSFARRVLVRGRDVTEQALGLMAARARPREAEYMQALGLIPSGYLRYYYAHDEALREMKASALSRGEAVAQIEAELIREYQDPNLKTKPARLSQRGGAHYSDVAVEVMKAVHHDTRQRHIVNVLNAASTDDLPHDAVVEVPASLGAEGPLAKATGRLPAAVRGLVQAVKAYEQLAVKAAAEGDRTAALHALIAHPLVPSVRVARQLLERLLAAHKEHLPQFFPS